MDTFGKRLSTLRKAKKMTQEDLAIKLNVTRQTISSWERDRSEPDITSLYKLADIFMIDMNELLKGIAHKENNKILPFLFIGTCLIQIAFAIMLIILHQSNSVGGVIMLFVLFIMNATIFSIIAYMNKTKDYTGLAGYDEDVKYNMQEVSNMLYRIRTHVCIRNLVWTVLFLLVYLFAYQQLWPILMVAYCIDFIGVILLENVRSRQRIYIYEKDQIASKRALLSMLVYLLFVLLWSLTFIGIFQVNKIHNNSKEAMILMMYLIIAIALDTIYLFFAQSQTRKANYQRNKEIRLAIIVVVVNVILLSVCVWLNFSI